MSGPVILIPNDFMGRRPLGYCGICEVPLYSDKDRDNHLRSGSHKTQVEIERAAQEAKRQRLAIFYDPESTGSDPEIAEHLKKVGQRMLREGRWTVKKNERAGFS